MRGQSLLVVMLAVAPSLALPPEEAEGQRLFETGRGTGLEVRARVGGTSLLGSGLPCAGCHGLEGEGRAEGGIAPPPVSWDELTKPYGHVHPAGRRHPPFTVESFLRAVNQGVDPAGNPLHPAMPRFSLTTAEARALVAYLRVIDRGEMAGVTLETIHLGTVLPTKGPAASIGRAMREALHSAIDAVNVRGGLHGRRLVLHEFPAERWAHRDDEKRATAQPVLALVGGLGPARALVHERPAALVDLPHVGPWTQDAVPPDGNVFMPMGGTHEQVKALLAARGDSHDPLLVFAPDRLAEMARSALGPRGSAVDVRPCEATWTEVARAGPRDVLWLCHDSALASLERSAARVGWSPRIFVPGSLAGAAALRPPPGWRGTVWLASPTLPSKHEGRSHPAAYDAMTLAVRVLSQALLKAGGQPSRAKLVAALEALQGFDSGLGPRIGFGPGRRVGAPGAYVLEVGPDGAVRRPPSWFAARE